jgi:uncharacterized membrane protein
VVIGLALPIAVAGLLIVFLRWSRRRAARRGELARWRRNLRRTYVALGIYFGGALVMTFAAVAAGLSTRQAGRLGACWQLAVLVGLLAWRLTTSRRNHE